MSKINSPNFNYIFNIFIKNIAEVESITVDTAIANILASNHQEGKLPLELKLSLKIRIFIFE